MTEKIDDMCGDDLVAMVRDDVVDHEIAGHSFAHTKYTDLSKMEARSDLRTLVDVAEAQGYDLTSFVAAFGPY